MSSFPIAALLLICSCACAADRSSDVARWDRELATANDKIPPYENRERLYLDEQSGQRENVRQAIETYESIVEAAPANYHQRDAALLALVHACILAGNDCLYRGFDSEGTELFTKATACADELLKTRPRYCWLFYKKGIAARAMGHASEAAEKFGKAIEASVEALMRSGGDGDTEAADILSRAQLDHAVSLAALQDYGKSSAALEALKIADFAWQREEISRTLGHVLMVQGRAADALAEFKTAAESAVEDVYSIEPQVWRWVFEPTPESRKVIVLSLWDMVRAFPFEERGMQWDRSLLAFLSWREAAPDAEAKLPAIAGLANGSPEALFSSLSVEEARRHGVSGVEIAALRVRAWFVCAVMYDHQASEASEPERSKLLKQAEDAYGTVQKYAGTRFYWECEHAKARLTALSPAGLSPGSPGQHR